MKLAIWFDIDCPNCFLAIKQFYRLYHYMGYRLEEDEITFYPIRLNPTLKTNTEKTYLEAFRSHSYLKRRKQEKAIKNFIILGQDEGIHFNFEKLFPFGERTASIFGSDYLKYGKQYWLFLLLGLLFSTKLPYKLYSMIKNHLVGYILLFLVFWLSVYAMYRGLDDPFLYFRF